MQHCAIEAGLTEAVQPVPAVHLYLRSCPACSIEPAEQERRTRAAAIAAGLQVDRVWREGGRKAGQQRAQLPVRAVLLQNLRPGGVLIIADTTVLGRSLADLVTTLAAIEAVGAMVLIVGVDEEAVRRPSSTDLDLSRRAYNRVAAAEGRARARARGAVFGRPRIPVEKTAAVQDAIGRGLGIRAAARAGGVGVATASRIRDQDVGRPPRST